MLSKLKPNQKAFIEISHIPHGGTGWEVGECLWSPHKDNGNAEAWKLMKKVSPGDIIFHLIKSSSSYELYGISKAASYLFLTDEEPPIPDEWANRAPYQRIQLDSFQKLSHPKPISGFLKRFHTQLLQIRQTHEKGQFFNPYKGSPDLRVSQKYFATCVPELYKLFVKFLDNDILDESDSITSYVPTAHEPQHPDMSAPARINTMVSRIVRDTQLSRQVKIDHNYRCQVCGEQIQLPNGNLYAEAHHIQPLGGEYEGLDIRENLIILCPNHHTEFDHASIAIEPDSGRITHIDPGHPINGKMEAYSRSELKGQLFYHLNERFSQE